MASSPQQPSNQQEDAGTRTAPRPPSTRTFPAHRPVLQPWQAADHNPEHLGNWGAKFDPLATASHRGTRRLVLLGLAVAVPTAAIALWHSLHSSTPPAPPVDGSSTPTPTAASAASAASATSARSAAATARAFLSAATLEERARFVRHPEVTRGRMQSWHTERRPFVPTSALTFHDRTAEEHVGPHTFVMLYVETADFSTRAIALEKLPDESFAVDWESFESWSEIPWIDFVGTEPLTPCEFRVVVERDSYFNFSYADSEAWACFKLSDPANSAHCWGYCRIDSEAASALSPMLRRQNDQGTSQAKAILRLRFADNDPGRRQVLIESVVQENWIKPNP